MTLGPSIVLKSECTTVFLFLLFFVILAFLPLDFYCTRMEVSWEPLEREIEAWRKEMQEDNE